MIIRPVWPVIIHEMQKRHQLGIERYGRFLQPFNGRDSLRDLMEELLDAVAYTKLLMMEQDMKQDGAVLLSQPVVFNDCNHGVVFSAQEAGTMSSEEVRMNWPRLDGPCLKGCGYVGIAYASYEHYLHGDW